MITEDKQAFIHAIKTIQKMAFSKVVNAEEFFVDPITYASEPVFMDNEASLHVLSPTGGVWFPEKANVFLCDIMKGCDALFDTWIKYEQHLEGTSDDD